MHRLKYWIQQKAYKTNKLSQSRNTNQVAPRKEEGYETSKQPVVVDASSYTRWCAVILHSQQRTCPDRATDSRKALAATVSLEMQDRSGTILGQGSGFFVRHK